MVGTIEFEEGDEFTHDTYGPVKIRGVTEELDSFIITDTGDDTVFDGGSVSQTTVRLEKEDGVIVHEPIEEFIDEIMD